MKHWIQTRNGIAFDLLRPTPEMVCLEDIAWSLSHQPRFNGHAGTYSVAEHSVLVSLKAAELAANIDGARRQGLMHDATEAFMGDIVSPLKAVPRLGDMIAEIEHGIWLAIAERFGLEDVMIPEVKEADSRMLATEKARFFPETPEDWGPLPEPFSLHIIGDLDQQAAEACFLEHARVAGIS